MQLQFKMLPVSLSLTVCFTWGGGWREGCSLFRWERSKAKRQMRKWPRSLEPWLSVLLQQSITACLQSGFRYCNKTPGTGSFEENKVFIWSISQRLKVRTACCWLRLGLISNQRQSIYKRKKANHQRGKQSMAWGSKKGFYNAFCLASTSGHQYLPLLRSQGLYKDPPLKGPTSMICEPLEGNFKMQTADYVIVETDFHIPCDTRKS